MSNKSKLSRRNFIKTSAVTGALGLGGVGILTSCDGAFQGGKSSKEFLKAPGTYYIPELPDMASDGKEIKAGVVGCGGRGSGAAINFLESAKGVTIVALGDVFQEKADNLAKRVNDKFGIDIPSDKRFVGLDAYKQVIDNGIDLLIDCTPPFFRAEHFKYAVEKNKHCFLEKPICVDAVGYRTVMGTARQAQAKKLSVVTGTQRHHQRSYVESYIQIMNGAIGNITGGAVYWNQSKLWHRDRQPGWSDFEFMVRDWVNWKWLSGDHIVEQHVHNIDVFTWFTGLKPVSAIGFGSRQRRITGDQYDNFSIDFTMENGIHMHSMCRQIDGCSNKVSEFIQGTKGYWTSYEGCRIIDNQGNEIWKFDYEAEKEQYQQVNPYTLEHVNLVNTIRSNNPIEQASETAVSNMSAIMGRESAYSGQEITWEAMTGSQLDYTPSDLNMGQMDMSGFTVPVPGKSL